MLKQIATDNSENWSGLIQKARAGCDQALVELIGHFESYLLLVANKRIGIPLQAKFGASDIVQMSLMEARESIGQFEGTSEGEIRGWLKRIVLNNLLDQSKQFTGTRKRSVARERSLTLVATQPSRMQTPSVMIRRRETDSELKNLVDQLPENQKRVVEGRHRFGLSYFQIAQQMNITEANARQLWSRAARRLREGLEEE